jgi:ribonucleoside-triphosphate reductase
MPLDLISEYLETEDKENANKFESYTKMRGFVADSYIKSWAKSNIYTKEVMEAHDGARFHIHDLSDGVVPYCKGHDATKLMTKGLITQTVTAGPPKHLSSFLAQCMNMMAYNQQHWAGAQAIANINTLAAPYVRKDNLPYFAIKQEVQRFIYDVNFPSRAGSQTPFINITLNFKCPPMMADEPVLVSEMEGTWGEYEYEANLILKAFIDVMLEGDSNGKPFTFPIITVNLTKDMDYDDPLWQQIVELSLKFGSVSFFNYDGSGIDQNSILSMCCRLQIDLNEIAPTGGRWAYAGETGSIGVITLNMSKIGYLATDKDNFYNILTETLVLARNALISKGLFIEQTKERFMPFDVEYGTDLSRFFRTIGVVGLNEMCVNFLGKPLSEVPEFALEVLNFIREWTRYTQKNTGLLWNLEMTPAEGCSSRLAAVDKELYGDIVTQGVEGSYYYTSMITPPNQELSLSERIAVEEDILPLFTGGTVHRVYVGEGYGNTPAMAKLIEKIAKSTKLPYFDISPVYAICEECGAYQRGASSICAEPNCDGEATTYDRIVGYYRPRKQANSGKVMEIEERQLLTF